MPNEEPSRQSAVAVVAHCWVGDAPISIPTPSLADFLQRTLELEPGFLHLLGCFEASSGIILCVTLWKSEADAERYDAHGRSALAELRCVLEESSGWAAAGGSHYSRLALRQHLGT